MTGCGALRILARVSRTLSVWAREALVHLCLAAHLEFAVRQLHRAEQAFCQRPTLPMQIVGKASLGGLAGEVYEAI